LCLALLVLRFPTRPGVGHWIDEQRELLRRERREG
jgi:hypothetical protein